MITNNNQPHYHMIVQQVNQHEIKLQKKKLVFKVQEVIKISINIVNIVKLINLIR
jgi:hypothetical protein